MADLRYDSPALENNIVRGVRPSVEKLSENRRAMLEKIRHTRTELKAATERQELLAHRGAPRMEMTPELGAAGSSTDELQLRGDDSSTQIYVRQTPSDRTTVNNLYQAERDKLLGRILELEQGLEESELRSRRVDARLLQVQQDAHLKV
ncbi:hypothetical protein CYMTET_38515 [Cymbomonas tetramitiformis]|uniref:Uncharacterized protein n=1 Tax=Cymbomonas tetramitiformis TaxID=36881 RepID=A0AAE0CDZ0_9CHLO|nr:hypothetical protein CYMTET_38515 [Cymbomonas tetramitiformis]